MIEGTDVYEYFLCPYKVYNRHNRDRSLLVPLSEFNKKLMELGIAHEKEMVSALKFVQPKYRDLEEGFKQTVKFMEKGAEIIYHGVLKYGDYLGIPDLLIRQEGASVFGSWHYIPAEIKINMRGKEEHVMQLLFYNMILDKIQEHNAFKGMLILKNTSEIVDIALYEDKFKEALQKIQEVSEGLDWGMHIDSVCKECGWRNVCYKLAEEKHDASLVYGLSRSLHYKLIEQGIKTVEDVVHADPNVLVQIEGITEHAIEKWKRQANVVITKKAEITKVKLPDTENRICLDLETSEDGSVYLIGLWHKNKFKYFFSEHDEQKILQEFIDYVLALKDYRLYHYGSFEKTVFRQLFEKYNIPDDISKGIFSNMIDMFQILRQNAMLPLMYYDLKSVAKHFGFSWRASDASGGNSIIWFETWKKNKDPELLKKILAYNEDDVKATDIVLEKISN